MRRSWLRRTCGTAVVSRESRTRRRCCRSPNTICVVRGVDPLDGVCTRSERLIATSLSKIEFACQICQLIVLDVQAPCIKVRAGFDLPFQPPSGDIDLLLAGQAAAPALKSSQAQTRNSNHGFFSIDLKEEKFRPIPLGQKTCTDELNIETAALRPHDLEPLVEGLVSHFGLSDQLPSM